jgi:hypothetical protein
MSLVLLLQLITTIHENHALQRKVKQSGATRLDRPALLIYGVQVRLGSQ